MPKKIAPTAGQKFSVFIVFSSVFRIKTKLKTICLPPPLKISAAARFSFLVLNFSFKNWAQKLEIPVFGDPGMIKIKSGGNLLFGEFAFWNYLPGIQCHCFNNLLRSQLRIRPPSRGETVRTYYPAIELREIYLIFLIKIFDFSVCRALSSCKLPVAGGFFRF